MANTEVTVSWPDLSTLPTECTPILADLATGQRVYMRTVAAYSFITGPGGGTRLLRVEVAGQRAGALMAGGVTAMSSGNGTVELRSTLTADAELEVEVLNIAGRRVAVVCRSRQCQAGPVVLLWSARADSGTWLPPGSYLVRLTARAQDGQQACSMGMLRLGR